MSCGGASNVAFLKSYYSDRGYSNYYSRTVRLMSTTQSGSDITDSFISDNWNAYATELQKLGNSVQYTGTENPTEQPYGSKLRPLDNFSYLNKAQHVLINTISFFAFDTTILASAEQSSAANTIIQNSAALLLNKYSYAGIYTAVLPSWNPNYFRPKVLINQQNILDFSQSALGNGDNKGDLSMGATLPYSIDPYFAFPAGISSITVNAAAAQVVTNGTNTYFKRYPIMCEINLTYV